VTSAAKPGERILVVDDEKDIVALVGYHLMKAGYRVSQASTGPEAVAMAKRERPALVVLDLMLPGMSGFDVLAKLREDSQTANIAVLMLTARKDERERIRGLELGADDYLTKPFSPQELVLRVGAILRRVTSAGIVSDVLQTGPIRVDRAAHRVYVDEQEVKLTPTEYNLLLALATSRGRTLGRTYLLETVFKFAPDIQTRTVDMHVQRLRSKLQAAGDLIETVRGFGYRLTGGTDA
jgi:two-component system phosphate regulon response regulator PhoB